MKNANDFVEGMSHDDALSKGMLLNTAISAGSVTLTGLANIINNVLEVSGMMNEMPDLYNNSITIQSDDADGHSFTRYNSTYPFYLNSSMNSMTNLEGDKIKITTFISEVHSATRSGRVFGGKLPSNMTHSGNIVSCFGAHEYLGHGKGGQGGTFNFSEGVAYKIQKNHWSFRHVSKDYQQHIINKYNYYNGSR
jgi:hypothetical protein